MTEPGRILKPEDAPKLFATMNCLRKELGTERIDRVIITADFNAGIRQHPLLGFFGWNENLVYLGLPLLAALAPKEFEAVLAHEFAHLSSRDGRFSSWVYRLRRSWERLFQQLWQPTGSQTRLFVRRWLAKPLGWYWPRFNAYAFVMSRADEYNADRFSAEWAGVEHAVAALWRINCIDRMLNETIWKELQQLAKTQPDPPPDVMARVIAQLRVPPNPEQAYKWMSQVINSLASNQDTHPSFSDRIKALSVSLDQLNGSIHDRREPMDFLDHFPTLPRKTAAEEFLGSCYSRILPEIETVWREASLTNWKAVFTKAGSQQLQLQHLESVSAKANHNSPQNPELTWERARTIYELESPTAAEPLLREILDSRPSHRSANLLLGRHLLEQLNPEGETYLQRILDQEDDDLIPPACEVLAAYFQTAGQFERAEIVRQRIIHFQTASTEAQRERSMVTSKDQFLPHEMSDEGLRPLRDLLAKQPNMGAAYLARKQVKFFPQKRLFVLCVRSPAKSWFSFTRTNECDATLVNQIVSLVKLPGRVLTVTPNGIFREVARKVIAVSDSQIFPYL